MKSKKVFVVKNFKSPYIEEAIFILREDVPSSSALPDAVSEAERIITGYLDSLDCPRLPKKRAGGRLFAAILALLALAGLIVLVF
ncbi:MAG: hypothetical protein E7408_03975 [Ruminococcaceae bacterium]|nr:hypothetical protein [Oscillospiraceae bacterium]